MCGDCFVTKKTVLPEISNWCNVLNWKTSLIWRCSIVLVEEPVFALKSGSQMDSLCFAVEGQTWMCENIQNWEFRDQSKEGNWSK